MKDGRIDKWTNYWLINVNELRASVESHTDHLVMIKGSIIALLSYVKQTVDKTQQNYKWKQRKIKM